MLFLIDPPRLQFPFQTAWQLNSLKQDLIAHTSMAKFFRISYHIFMGVDPEWTSGILREVWHATGVAGVAAEVRWANIFY